MRFKSMLLVIFGLIVVCSAIGVGYLFYNKVIKDETVVVVDGDITINFLNGNKFSANTKDKLEFSVTNNSDEEGFYYIKITDLKGKIDTVTYEIKSSTNDLNVADNLKSEILPNSIAIEGKKTDTYTIEFKSNSTEKYSGEIKVVAKQNENNTFAEIIMKNNDIKDSSTTSVGVNATTDEGLIKSTDDLGIAYYFRGNIENNYVSFANNIWRIVKINGDGSIKLVLNTLTDVLNKYYDGDDYKFISASISKDLDNWYQMNLNQYTDYIANYKFCNDYVLDESTNAFAAYNRITKDTIPTFVCLGAQDNKKIGLLTADEVMLAGASLEKNTSYYLYNSNITAEYFTMTSGKLSTKYYPFSVTTDGALSVNTEGTLLRGVRPVINIVNNVLVTGTGTAEDPYLINID